MSNEIIQSLYQIGAIQFGEFVLKSGKTSSIYINLRKIISYPDLLRTIANAMWEKIKSCQFDLVCGVPYTALPIATCVSLDHGIPMIMRRKEKKDYGTKQMVEGVFKPDQTCFIIEDIITTGGSILETADELENAGLRVQDVIALIDREQGGKENLTKKYRVHTLFTLSDVLMTLLNSTLLNATERGYIEQFLLEKTAQ
jgi:orotate phosphoribosyltransferase